MKIVRFEDFSDAVTPLLGLDTKVEITFIEPIKIVQTQEVKGEDKENHYKLLNFHNIILRGDITHEMRYVKA